MSFYPKKKASLGVFFWANHPLSFFCPGAGCTSYVRGFLRSPGRQPPPLSRRRDFPPRAHFFCVFESYFLVTVLKSEVRHRRAASLLPFPLPLNIRLRSSPGSLFMRIVCDLVLLATPLLFCLALIRRKMLRAPLVRNPSLLFALIESFKLF